MKNLTITSPGSLYDGESLTEERITELKVKFEIPFPENLKNLLMKYGGYRIEESVYDNKSTLEIFLGSLSLDRAIEAYRWDDGINLSPDGEWWSGENWIPFATDPGGWTYMMNIHKSKFGEIYFDRNHVDDVNDIPIYFFLEPTLESFLDKLEPSETNI